MKRASSGLVVGDSCLEQKKGLAYRGRHAATISYRGLYQFFLLQQFHPAAIAMWAVIVARGKKWRRRPIRRRPPLSADKIG